MIPTLFVVSILTFIVIPLPPGDFMTTLAAQSAESGGSIDAGAMESLRQQYGLDQPLALQYLTWVSGFPRSDTRSVQTVLPTLQVNLHTLGKLAGRAYTNGTCPSLRC
jgi:ABC-type dipeptide/oligopeptide/nickel transport system permease component